jgi:hypothetical protein
LDFASTNSILKIVPQGMLAMHAVIMRALSEISPLVYSSFHSLPRTLIEAGLSSFASRKGLAANAGAPSKIDIIVAKRQT